MKTKLTLSISALVCATMLSLTACGPDEPETNPNPEPTSDGLTDKWVLSSYREADSQSSIRLKYDNKGRVIEMTYDNSNEVYTYTYSSNSIGWEKFNQQYPNGHREQHSFYLRSGLVSTYFNNNTNEYVFTYDSSKRVSNVVAYGVDNYTMNWNEGQLEEINCKVYYDDDEDDKYWIEYDIVVNYARSNPINESCTHILNAILLDFINEFCIDWMVAAGGYYGKMPSNLITGISSTFDNEFFPNQVTYGNIDSEGCPGTMTITNGRRQSTTCYLTWQKL